MVKKEDGFSGGDIHLKPFRFNPAFFVRINAKLHLVHAGGQRNPGVSDAVGESLPVTGVSPLGESVGNGEKGAEILVFSPLQLLSRLLQRNTQQGGAELPQHPVLQALEGDFVYVLRELQGIHPAYDH